MEVGTNRIRFYNRLQEGTENHHDDDLPLLLTVSPTVKDEDEEYIPPSTIKGNTTAKAKQTAIRKFCLLKATTIT